MSEKGETTLASTVALRKPPLVKTKSKIMDISTFNIKSSQSIDNISSNTNKNTDKFTGFKTISGIRQLKVINPELRDPKLGDAPLDEDILEEINEEGGKSCIYIQLSDQYSSKSFTEFEEFTKDPADIITSRYFENIFQSDILPCILFIKPFIKEIDINQQKTHILKKISNKLKTLN